MLELVVSRKPKDKSGHLRKLRFVLASARKRIDTIASPYYKHDRRSSISKTTLTARMSSVVTITKCKSSNARVTEQLGIESVPIRKRPGLCSRP